MTRGSLRTRLAETIALDLRSLAVLRIGVALALLVDLLLRARDLRAHYTDFGILPRAELGAYTARSVWTLHGLASPSPTAVAALFAIAALLALALGLGLRTRLAAFGSWVLLTSLQYRNPPLVFGGDVMLRMLLFWGLFLPLGARWSLDARRRAAPPLAGADRVASLATLALLVQVALVYAFTVLNRTGPTWWDGRALEQALHFDQFASRAGVWLRESGAPLAGLTHAAIWFEGLGFLPLFVPFANGPLRTLTAFLFVGFHATLAVLFNIGLFPLVFSVAWLGLLPTWFWERLGPAFRRGGGLRVRLGAGDALAAVALVLVLLSNLSTLQRDPRVPYETPAWARPAEWLYVDQLWALFAPDPPRYDGWYAFLGVQADGAQVDPFWNRPWRGPDALAKPEVVSETMNVRWREFFFALQRDARDPRWTSFGRWLCRRWNETHAGPERLDRAYVYFVEETTGGGPRPDRILTLLVHACE